jgi:hypothetical protein
MGSSKALGRLEHVDHGEPTEMFDRQPGHDGALQSAEPWPVMAEVPD